MTKICKQCGRELPIQSYRPLYSGKGTYNACLDCEAFNSRFKYLRKKERNGTATQQECEELAFIAQTYDKLRQMGLKPPNVRKNAIDIMQVVQDEYDADARHWLTAELTEKPEYYIDEVFETLKGASKELRDQVLDRFYEYEDQYYGGDVDVEEGNAEGSN